MTAMPVFIYGWKTIRKDDGMKVSITLALSEAKITIGCLSKNCIFQNDMQEGSQ